MIDSHIHLSFLSQSDLKTYLDEATELGVKHFIMAGYDADDWAEQERIKREYQNVSTCVGIHPWVAQSLGEDEFKTSFQCFQIKAKEADFIGEMGLDGVSAHTETDWARQLRCFDYSLEVAKDLDKPLVIHSVQTHPEVIDKLQRIKANWTGLVHAFSGPRQAAEEFIRLGLFISIGPGLLKPGYRKLKEAAAKLPLESLVIETDYPDPKDQEPYPELLGQVLLQLAQVRGVSAEEIAPQLEKNSRRLLQS